MDFEALAGGGAPGVEEDKFGGLGEDPLAEDIGGGDLMSALTGAGYNPTPDQIAQIEKILGGGMDTALPEDDLGGLGGDLGGLGGDPGGLGGMGGGAKPAKPPMPM